MLAHLIPILINSLVVVSTVHSADHLVDVTSRVEGVRWSKTGFAGTAESFFISTTGTGQICYDSEVWHVATDGNQVRRIGAFGPDSNKEQESSIFQRAILAHACGMIDSDTVILSFVAWPQLAEEPPTDVAGRVVIYEVKSDRFINLSQLDGSMNEYIEALAFFPDVGVLLMERSEQIGSDMPQPTRGTGVSVCMDMSTREIVPIEDYPSINAWFKMYQSLRLKLKGEYPWPPDPETGMYHWLVVQEETGHSVEIQTAEKWPRPEMFPLWNGFLLLSGTKSGTELARIDGSIRIRISDHNVFDVDIGTGVAALRSQDGRRTFLLDLHAFLAELTLMLPEENGTVPLVNGD